MAKKVLVISASLRNRSNSEMLADSFAQGAKAAVNEVEKITLKDKSISFCRCCLACQKTKRCVIGDDAVEIAEKMRTAEVIAFASPIYYYEMSGQMKTLLDRANSLYTSDYAFREIYFLSAAADDAAGTDDRAIHGLEGWIACFEQCRLAGTVFAGGVNGGGEIEGSPALKEAYRMGAEIS